MSLKNTLGFSHLSTTVRASAININKLIDNFPMLIISFNVCHFHSTHKMSDVDVNMQIVHCKSRNV